MNCLVHHTLLIPPSLLHSCLLPPPLPPSPPPPPHLQAGVALVLQQDLNHTHVALVHGYVEWRLLALVPGIEVHPVPGQEVDNVCPHPCPGGGGGREGGREKGGRKGGGERVRKGCTPHQLLNQIGRLVLLKHVPQQLRDVLWGR